MVKRAAMAAPAWSWQLKIELLDVVPTVWRRLIVPESIKLPTLHRAFQAALGWTDSHLHEFVIGGVRYSDPDPDMDEDLQQDERKVLLREAMGMDTRCFDYVYDFGDDWHHVVVVEDQHIAVKKPPAIGCEDGENACPPEDMGGALRYADFLAPLPIPSTKSTTLSASGLAASTPGISTWQPPTRR